MFNFWRKYPRRKPKESGHYLCSIFRQSTDDAHVDRTYVHRLYYDAVSDKWTDFSRQSVFEGYQVYKHCRATIQENRVYTDGLCKPGVVLAWKKLPKAYGKRRK